jgi:RHS repeat-associated protein
VTPSYPLLVDTSLYSNGATLTNVVLSGNLGGSSVAKINWLVTDQLGTPRMIFDQTGSLATTKRHDYLPFGEELFAGTGGRTTAQGYTGDSIRQKFTDKERDIETGLDYFGARYYSSIQGRFASVDPSRKSIEVDNPQSWNRYSYTLNNPLRYVDHNGKWPTETHNQLIRQAFPGLSERESAQIQRGSESVDVKYPIHLPGKITVGVPITLLPGEAYKHAMTPEGWTKKEARTAGLQWIDQKSNEAKNLQSDFSSKGGTGLSEKALVSFGEGSHTLMDNTSPAHYNYQLYSIPRVLIPIPGAPGSYVLLPNASQYTKEQMQHIGKESDEPTEEQRRRAVADMQAYYLRTFGEEAFHRAIKKP